MSMSSLRLGLILVIALIHASVIFSQEEVYEAWVARYNGPGNSDDQATALVQDNSGNVYVTGFSRGNGTGWDYATIKYSPAGEELWVARYNGPISFNDLAYALAVDQSGNVYVTGGSFDSSGLDYATIKYSPSGESLWVRRYNGPGDSADWANDLAVDQEGNVYVTGQSGGIGSQDDYATIKYSPNGDSLWVRRYNGMGNENDVAKALAVDDSGNILVTGYSVDSVRSADFLTIKYSPSGDTLWVRRLNGPGNMSDNANDIALDDSGNAYVTGHSWGVGTSHDYLTVKYSAAGAMLWASRYDGPDGNTESAYAISVDPYYNVCVTGYSLGSTSSMDYATVKYSSDGDTVWVRRHNGSDNAADLGNAIEADHLGNVYVTGESPNSGSFTDFVTIKYSSSGNSTWLKRYNGPGNGSDRAEDLELDDSGNVYVTGHSAGDESSDDYATIKYSPCSAESPLAGDASSDQTYTLVDIIATVNYIFNRPGFAACSSNSAICWLSDRLCRGDWNGSGDVTLGDVIQGANFIFDKSGGPWSPVSSLGCCPYSP